MQDTLHRFKLRLRSAYMRGWDDRLIRPEGGGCPYNRADFVSAWKRGNQACNECKPLPYWYNEWLESR